MSGQCPSFQHTKVFLILLTILHMLLTLPKVCKLFSVIHRCLPKGLNSAQATWANHCYHGHQVLPKNILEEFSVDS